ncbi:hypothetical protein [Phenylobacterium zucineum]|uniref:hypothetical protein n=1 Tax=Phenylobacterium zucineum TaxID=284016 RepID=UPI0002FE27D1|nr:hypothetical protein [Phenylobacterium zucineum]
MKLVTLLAAASAAVALNLGALPAASFDYETVDDAVLQDNRGGMLLAGGVPFQFGAVMSTYENGMLSLQTHLVWTPDGAVVQQIPGDGVIRLDDAALQNMAGAGQTFQTVGGSFVAHDLTQGQLTNFLLNTQSGRDFRQDLELTLVLPGFVGVQNDMGRQLTGLRLVDDLAASSISALGG